MTKVALSPAGDAHPTKTNTIGTLILGPREREANWQHSPKFSASCLI